MTNKKAKLVKLSQKELCHVFGGGGSSGTGIASNGNGTGVNAAGGGTGVYSNGNGTGK